MATRRKTSLRSAAACRRFPIAKTKAAASRRTPKAFRFIRPRSCRRSPGAGRRAFAGRPRVVRGGDRSDSWLRGEKEAFGVRRLAAAFRSPKRKRRRAAALRKLSGSFVRAHAVDRRERDVEHSQVDRELSAVVIGVIHGYAEKNKPSECGGLPPLSDRQNESGGEPPHSESVPVHSSALVP